MLSQEKVLHHQSPQWGCPIPLEKCSPDEVLAPYRRQLAAESGVVGSARVLRLSFLALEIVKALLRDQHPIGLNARRLASQTRLPIVWDGQRTLLVSE